MHTMSELDSFVLKFKQLWNRGHEAHLEVDSKSGKAWVGLHLCLGNAPGPVHETDKFKISPSRERRRIRRSAAKEESSNIETNTSETKEEFSSISEEDAVEIAEEIDQTETEYNRPVRHAIETVYVTAVIENSCSSQVTDNEVKALHEMIRSKEHLNRNVFSVSFESVQSYQLRSGKYEHTVQTVIHVKTASLWENTRSYFFHHLGRDAWNLRDGSEVRLKRIHKKI